MTQEEVNALWASVPIGPFPCVWRGCTNTVEYIDNSYCPEHVSAFYALINEPISTLEIVGGRARTAADMSPEAVAAHRLAKARESEAVAWVRAYTGTWGLPLDIRASAKWGTKYLSLTERQVDALLAGKARDAAFAAARAQEVANAATDPLTVWLKGLSGHMGGFLASLQEQVNSGRTLSPRQREAAQRIKDEQIARPEPSTDVTQPRGEVVEGMYRNPEGTIWKVVKAVHGSGRLYAQRLEIDGTSGHFEYDGGAIRRIDPAWLMTLEQAKEFGSLYGFCVRCGATLTDDVSIKAGIGPICAGRF